MEKQFILTVDQSTSGTKALVIDRSGSILAKSTVEHKQYYPQPGWVEHDPIEIYDNVKHAIQQVFQLSGISPVQIVALTITNQRETAVMWDKITGQPIYNAIVWQCQRTSDLCATYQAQGYEDMVRNKTGLMIDPYFSASKWAWMLEHVPNAHEKVAQDRLLAGTIDSWLLWKLSGGKIHATDYSNASRTSLFNIHTLSWDREMCSLFRVPIKILPEVKSSNTVFGFTNDPDLFEERIPISGLIGDSQGALFGQLCTLPGMAKATYGTGTSVLMNIGAKPVCSCDGLVTTVAWGLGGQITYAIEAIIRTTGDCIKWVRDNLGLFTTFEEMEELLAEAPDTQGVYLIPAFVGLGAPYWDPYARAAIIGMNRGTRKAHIVRAALESIAYQVRDAVELIQEGSGIYLEELRTDGGASQNEGLMQFQADILGRKLTRSHISELSALGSAYLGGLGVGLWETVDDISQIHTSYVTYHPMIDQDTRSKRLSGWEKSVAAVIGSDSKAI